MVNLSNSEIIKNISNGWLDYRSYCSDTNTNGNVIKKIKSDHLFYDLFINQWKQKIEDQIPKNKFIVKTSLGEGNLSAIPWLAIMNKSITEKTSNGWYLVYLFSRSTSKLYLCMGIGSLQFVELSGKKHFVNNTLSKIASASAKFRSTFQEYFPEDIIYNIDLLEENSNFESQLRGSSKNLVKSYENGTCFAKQYDVQNIDDYNLDDDLNKFIYSYDQIILDSASDNIDIISENFVDLPSENIVSTYEIPEFSKRIKKNPNNNVSLTTKAKNNRRTKESKKIGLAGESYVYKYEYLKLKENGLLELAEKIETHYEKYEYPGWDITSYDLLGNKIFIEVKSTKGKKINNLEITDNEWNAAKKEGRRYNIYLVVNALNGNIRISERIHDPYKLTQENFIKISTSVYKLDL